MAFTPNPSIDLLIRSINTRRLGHSYLFSGDSLEDLEQVAKSFSETLSCLSRPFPLTQLSGCGVCPNCKLASRGTLLDVHWVRPEKKSRIVSIDQVRELMRQIHLRPSEQGMKVGVVVAVDRMPVAAANAFLKTLEEPPANSVLLLLTTNLAGILDTIISRCLRLNFNGLVQRSCSSDDIFPFLQRVINLIVTSPLPFSITDRYRCLATILQSLADLRGLVESRLTGASLLSSCSDIESDVKSRLEEELEAAIEASYRYQRTLFIQSLLAWFRDVFWIGLEQPGFVPAIPELTEYTKSLASKTVPHRHLENVQVLENLSQCLETNAQESLALEVACLTLRF